ncbi:PAS domain-containing sensor histidine kinase [Adhaeribacter swui]|uniref:histidine kinase n=1 Tax=Adhaeribacter swui TaxID=2086471 RepID=A0A7G7GE98_9BACT|nr:PAS domain-containing sensor histidine kinase [Adhaeribacter swui]QNF35482.1 PAS domain-containing sensor histidine kinase [Adhaeribacter swui]
MSLPVDPTFIYSQFINQVKEYAIFATDNNGIITFWNEGAERIKGYKDEEIIGKYYGILFPDEYQKEGKPEREVKLSRENGLYEAEDWRKHKDGTLFWAKVALTPIYGPDGNQIGFTKVTQDLTEQKKLKDELNRQHEEIIQKNNELKVINVDLDNFIYTASHDLKSPIANIEGLIDLLTQELSECNCLDTATSTILEHVTSSIKRFKGTVKDLTEISKLHKNLTQGLAEEEINIRQIYEEIMEVNGLSFSNAKCEIETDFQVEHIRYSRKNFRSILYNLLSNAYRYHSPDRNCIIQIKTFEDESHVVLSVKDNGLGIKETNQKKLFTMFKRFHNHVEGTGIGLYMIKRIIENVGGKIEVESEENKGTEFKVFFKKLNPEVLAKKIDYAVHGTSN